MTYRETLAYLDSFINYETKSVYPYKQSFKLQRMRDFLSALRDPQRAFSSIHVAGTKGKGSTCAFCASMLREAGYRVGLYTSPHLVIVRERIRVLEPGADAGDFAGMISPGELCATVSALKPAIDAFCRNSPYGALSFFEIYTAIAFEYFRRKGVDIAVLETGLGGRLDATNVVDPLVCGITSISIDHTGKLGTTLAEIASEKAGIIKRRADTPPVVCAPQRPAALAVIRKRCRLQGASLFLVGKDLIIRRKAGKKAMREFSVSGTLTRLSGARIRLLGDHQVVNAAVAVGMCAAAFRRGFKVTPEAMRAGLEKARWPGRFEIISRDPLVILDGAHNVDSARTLCDTARSVFPGRRMHCILGISRDKNMRGICRNLLGVTRDFTVTRADNPRAFRPEEIARCIRSLDRSASVTVTRSIGEAVRGIRRRQGYLVTGSIFVVGEARKLLSLASAGRGDVHGPRD